jgi:hypothetical protein
MVGPGRAVHGDAPHSPARSTTSSVFSSRRASATTVVLDSTFTLSQAAAAGIGAPQKARGSPPHLEDIESASEASRSPASSNGRSRTASGRSDASQGSAADGTLEDTEAEAQEALALAVKARKDRLAAQAATVAAIEADAEADRRPGAAHDDIDLDDHGCATYTAAPQGWPVFSAGAFDPRADETNDFLAVGAEVARYLSESDPAPQEEHIPIKRDAGASNGAVLELGVIGARAGAGGGRRKGIGGAGRRHRTVRSETATQAAPVAAVGMAAAGRRTRAGLPPPGVRRRPPPPRSRAVAQATGASALLEISASPYTAGAGAPARGMRHM